MFPLLGLLVAFLLPPTAHLAAAPADTDAAGEALPGESSAGDEVEELETRKVLRGPMLFGAEAHQVIMRTGDGAAFLPGLALRARREIGIVSVGARVDAAFNPGGCSAAASGPCRSATLLATGQPEILFSLAPDALTSAYLGASGGVAVVRFDGRVAAGEDREALSKWGYIMGLRFGVEWLRHAAVRFDAFVQADIPFFETSSNESYLMEAYTPSVRAGVGVSF